MYSLPGGRGAGQEGAGLPAGNAGRIASQSRLEGQVFFKRFFSPLWGPFLKSLLNLLQYCYRFMFLVGFFFFA